MTYGSLSNIHFAQKYGFTTFDSEEQDAKNTVQGNYTFGEYQQIIYEEQRLKDEFSNDLQIPFNPEYLQTVNLFPNKFD